MEPRSVVVLAVIAVAMPACGRFLCPREAIRATLRAPLIAGEDAVSDTLSGNFEADRDENDELDAVEAAIEGRALSGRGVTIELERGLDHTLRLSLRFPTPLRPGDVLPVVGVHSPDRASWGTFPSAPAGLTAGLRLFDSVATSATGSARIVGVNPLRVDLDLVASDGARELPIRGPLAVSHESWTDSCFQ